MPKSYVLILILFLLVGCTTKKEEKINDDKLVEVKEPKLDYEKLYQEGIETYAQYEDNEDLNEFENTSIVAHSVNMGYYEAISYTFYDLNEDGIDEMIMALRSDDYHSIVDFYTLKNNEMIRLTSGKGTLEMIGERVSAHILKDGKILTIGSSGAMDTYYSLYEMNEDANELDHLIETHNDPSIFNEEDKININELEWTDIFVLDHDS